jgi:PAS domain S-box-containing protein
MHCNAEPFLRPDGSIEWQRWEVRPWHDSEGRVGGVVVFLEDITEQQQAVADLAERERRFNDLTHVAADAYWELDHNLRFTRGGLNNAYVGLAPWEIPGLDPNAPTLQAHFADLQAHRSFRDFQFPIEEPSRGRLHFAISGQALHDRRGEFVGYRGVIRNITARIEAEEELRASEARHRTLIDSIHAGVFIAQDDRFVFCNHRFAEMLGADETSLQGARCDSAIASYDVEMFRRHCGRVAEAGTPDSTYLTCRHQRDAAPVLLQLHAAPIDHDGRPAVLGTVTALSERGYVEERSHRTQQPESIGRLAGDIAHHFNNLLAVILGNLELLSPELPDGPLWKRAALALRSAQRGAELTHRLLAFGGRQPLRPETLDVNKLVTDLADVLRETAGEAVAVEMALQPQIPLAYVDRAQLEAALHELALNARAAMPRGGRIVIETANATLDDTSAGIGGETTGFRPGIMLAVTDTGVGMKPSVTEQACEPFFTTAETGQRVGLGLSMVSGFVAQSGGRLQLESMAGVGTSVRLYLPASRA